MIYAVQFNQNSLLITTDVKAWAITSDSHQFYTKIRELAKEEVNWPDAEAFLDVSEHIRNFVDSRFTVTGSIIEFEGRSIGEKMSEYMFRMMDENIKIDPLIKFIVNLRENPSNRAVNELYNFMNVNQLPLTPDGHFLAYKFVSDDYKDCHSGKIDNSVGATPIMPRNAVDDNKDVACSEGLHFCSMEYLKNGWGHRWMIVKINPRDVVSIPVDYNNTKGRCCTYEVISELDKPEEYQNMDDDDLNVFDSVVDNIYDTSDDEYEYEEDDEYNEYEDDEYEDDEYEDKDEDEEDEEDEELDSISWAKIGATDGANDRDAAKSQKRSYASNYNPKHICFDYKHAYDKAFNDRSNSTTMSLKEYETLGTQHGAADRSKAKRIKKSYDSVRNHRVDDVVSNTTYFAYVDAYEKAFTGK